MSAPGNQYNPRAWPTTRRRRICRWWIDVAETECLQLDEFASEWGLTRRVVIGWIRRDRRRLGVTDDQIRRWANA